MLNRDNKLWAPWRMEHIKRDLSNDKNKCVLCVDVNNSNDRKNLILHRGKFSSAAEKDHREWCQGQIYDKAVLRDEKTKGMTTTTTTKTKTE